MNYILAPGIIPLSAIKVKPSLKSSNGTIPATKFDQTFPGPYIFSKYINDSTTCSNPTYSALGLYRHASELYYKYDYKPFFDAGVLRNSLANEVYEGLL